jgi:hypothetical protein
VLQTLKSGIGIIWKIIVFGPDALVGGRGNQWMIGAAAVEKAMVAEGSSKQPQKREDEECFVLGDRIG